MPKKYGVKEKDLVVSHVVNLVLTGKLRSGDRVDRNEIANDLGLSRVPIQEAVVQLEHDGILSTQYHRGAYVERFDNLPWACLLRSAGCRLSREAGWCNKTDCTTEKKSENHPLHLRRDWHMVPPTWNEQNPPWFQGVPRVTWVPIYVFLKEVST